MEVGRLEKEREARLSSEVMLEWCQKNCAERDVFWFPGRQYDLSRRVDTTSSGSPRQSQLKHIVLNNNNNNNNNKIANNAQSKI